MVEISTSSRLFSSTHEPVVIAATQIRRRLRSLLPTWDVGPDTVDDILLVVEELVANALDHAGSRFEIVVRLDHDVLFVAVHDGDTAAPCLRPFDPHAARGRGLQLVATLSRRWGYEARDGGKTVWAELPV